MKKKVFVINPERGATEKERLFTRDRVTELENDGYEVWWSKRDNPDDLTPIQRSTINFRRMFDSDKVYVVYANDSHGSIFEFGWIWSLYMLVEKILTKFTVNTIDLHIPQIIFANKDWFEGDNQDWLSGILLHLEKMTEK